MIQPPDSNHKSTPRGTETLGKSVHKHSRPKSMKYYSLMLALVAVTAAIVLAFILLLEQKLFFKLETSATLSYNPVAFSDKVYTPSISELLRLFQADIVKKEAFDLTNLSDKDKKEKYIKSALDISEDRPENSNNLLKVTVKWNDKDEASQLTDNYIKSAIKSYFLARTGYLTEMQKKLIKARQEKEARLETIEKHLSQLFHSIQDESVKAELETLKTRRNRQEEELFDLRKQLETTFVQNEGLKIITPNKDKRLKIKNALQHAYVMELIQKRNDSLEEFEVQKATGKETDLQYKQAQIRYGYIDDCLKAKLDELNLSEQDILDIDSASLSRMEEMESSEARLIVLNKQINAAQENLAQIQKQISDACKLLPQEEKLNEERGKLLSQISEIDQDVKNIGGHVIMAAIELQSLGFINIHYVNMFTSHSYILIILIGIIITTSLLSLLMLVIELARPKAKAQAVTKQ